MNINIRDLRETTHMEDDTQLIQTAIDECSGAGGGRVTIPADKVYVVGGIMMKSNVELHLDENALLQGNGCEQDYIMRPGPFERIRNNTPISGLIYAKDANNISITGTGKIDGNYKKFILDGQEEAQHIAFHKYPRPMTVYFENCTNVILCDVTLADAPFWTVHLVGCREVDITGVKIFNEIRMPNTDGFDIDRCKNVRISDCIISTGDDAICPKCTEETAQYGDCEGVVVKNCTLRSGSSAVKFGSSSFGNFKNFSFENIQIYNTNRGLAFQLRDTHGAENIKFKNISISTRRYSKEWWGTGEPIYVTVCEREDGMKTGKIKNVVFEDIICECENGVFLYTDSADSIEGVTFKNVSLDFNRTTEYELSRYDLRPCHGDETYFEALSPLVAVNVNGISLENFNITDKGNLLEQKQPVFKNCRNVSKS